MASVLFRPVFVGRVAGNLGKPGDATRKPGDATRVLQPWFFRLSENVGSVPNGMKISVTTYETGTCALGPYWYPPMSQHAKDESRPVTPIRSSRLRSSPHEGALGKSLSTQDLGVNFMPFGTLPRFWPLSWPAAFAGHGARCQVHRARARPIRRG